MATSDEERVPEARVPEVQRRLREVRGDLSLRKTARRVEDAATELGSGIAVNHTDVHRFEGSNPDRSPSPTVSYVKAFAKAFGQEESYLLAEDVPDWRAEDLREMWARRKEARERHFRREEPATPEEEERDSLRDQVRAALGTASRIPPPERRARTRPYLPRETLAWIHDDLQRIFWNAFAHRGLPPDQLLERAFDLGALIPSPPRLEGEGFLGYSDLDEERLKRWWMLQGEALRLLLRPNDFEPEDMNLGRFGEGGYSIPWEEYVSRWDESPEPEKEKTLKKIRQTDWDRPRRVRVSSRGEGRGDETKQGPRKDDLREWARRKKEEAEMWEVVYSHAEHGETAEDLWKRLPPDLRKRVEPLIGHGGSDAQD